LGRIKGANGGGACAACLSVVFPARPRRVLAARLDFPLQSQKIKVMEIILLLG